jgi:hypothetical protein
VSVVDIVENFNIQPYDLKKAAFVAWAKQFMQKRKVQPGKSDPIKVALFMENVKKFASSVTQYFADFEFYIRQSSDTDDSLMCSTTENDKHAFYFLERVYDSLKCQTFL